MAPITQFVLSFLSGIKGKCEPTSHILPVGSRLPELMNKKSRSHLGPYMQMIHIYKPKVASFAYPINPVSCRDSQMRNSVTLPNYVCRSPSATVQI